MRALAVSIASVWRCSTKPRVADRGALRSNGRMYANVMFFVLGVALLQRVASLPSRESWLCLGVVACAALLLCRGSAPRRVVGMAILFLAAGFGWAGWRAELRLAEALPMQYEGRDLEITGLIESLPERRDGDASFVLRVVDSEAPVPSRVQLAWYGGRGEEASELPRLWPGQRWHLVVRLRRPHARFNPHGSDAEGRLLEAGIRATGYVRRDPAPVMLASSAGGWRVAIEGVRAALRERFEAALGDRHWRGLLVAITLGEQQAIDAGQWSFLQRSGLVHLAVVSGLHVSIMAGLAGLLAAGWWRRTELALLLPAQKFGVLGGLAFAWGYALLAGLGIPLQRSVLMLSALALCLLLNRRVTRPRMLALALVVVVVVDPWCVIAPGFWLSFCAVSILLLATTRRAPGVLAMLRAAASAQLAINIAMIPALLIFFQQFSLVAPLANLVAVPVVSFLVLPLCLLFALVPLDSFVLAAHAIVEAVLEPLGWLAASPLGVWQQAAPPAALLAVAALGCAWSLLPRGTPARLPALVGLLPVLLYQPPRPAAGEFELRALDVGQGLAVHVRTAHHDLLFDAGPRWPGGDAGRSVVLPYLRAAGVDRLDALVVTHADADHAGGAASIVAELPVLQRIAHAGADPARLGAPGIWSSCSDGAAWQWDEVGFRWLNPPEGAAGDWPANSGNNRSCVLRIEGRGGRALLTADIESAVEARLVAEAPLTLAAELVVAPHHGSRSSSSPALVAAAGARAVVFSAGYRSPFGHPHAEVWARWAAAGATGYRTDSQGAIRARFGAGGLEIATERELRPRYWHGR